MSIILTVDEHGNVNTGGTYFGPNQRVIKRRGSLIVTHVPGHSTFAGQGRRRYEEANYHVFRIDHPTGEPGQWKVDHMLTFSARPYPPMQEELDRWRQT